MWPRSKNNALSEQHAAPDEGDTPVLNQTTSGPDNLCVVKVQRVYRTFRLQKLLRALLIISPARTDGPP